MKKFKEMTDLFLCLDNFIRENFNDGIPKMVVLQNLKNVFNECIDIVNAGEIKFNEEILNYYSNKLDEKN